MLWFGLVLLVVGAILFFVSTRSSNKAFHAKATETSKIGDLASLVGEIAGDMPAGMSTGFKDYVEVKGRVACDTPIMGELSDVPAAIFETRVRRVVERREERRDAQGNVRTEWRKSEETVSDNRREAPFYIEDDTGRIRVKPNKKIELEKVVDRFEPAEAIEFMSGGSTSLSFGRFRMSLGSGGFGSHSRTLGYKFTEHILPVGKTVYALGEAADTDDEGLVLRKPTDEQKGKPFMLSLKTEEEIVRSAEKSAMVMKVISAVLAVGGVALVVVGLL